MLCSNCSEKVQPIVALDIDGTLGDFHGHFIQFLERYLNWRHGHCCGYVEYDGSCAFSEWAILMYGIDYRTWQDIKLAYRQGAQKRSMPFKPGAQEVVLAAIEHGCELWLTTTRPYLRLDNIDPDTRFWLDKVLCIQDCYKGVIYDEFKYERFSEIVDVDRVILVLEDLPDMYDAAAKLFGEEIPILVDSQYNSNVLNRRNYRMVADLFAIPGIIGQRTTKWRLIHEN